MLFFANRLVIGDFCNKIKIIMENYARRFSVVAPHGNVC